jgi:MFS family permease
MLGLTQNYITPYALTMKATTQQIGLLTSVPNFTMAAAQFAAPALSEKMGSRKGFIVPMVVMHALIWLPILLIPYLFQTHQVWWLIAFVTLGTAFDAAVNPAWGSMMAGASADADAWPLFWPAQPRYRLCLPGVQLCRWRDLATAHRQYQPGFHHHIRRSNGITAGLVLFSVTNV